MDPDMANDVLLETEGIKTLKDVTQLYSREQGRQKSFFQVEHLSEISGLTDVAVLNIVSFHLYRNDQGWHFHL